MSKLIFMFDGNVIGEFAINKQRVSIGRRPSNDIHIDNLAVSGEHAAIVTLGTDLFLEDLSSTNGTFVNKKRIKKHALQNQDMIELGKYQLKFVGSSAMPASAPAAETVETMVPLSADATETGSEAPSPAPVVNAISEPTPASTPPIVVLPPPSLPKKKSGRPVSMQVMSNEALVTTNTPMVADLATDPLKEARIKLMTGAEAGTEIHLGKTMTQLGKHGMQLAVLTKRPNGYYLTHIGGKTRPLVNGKEIGVYAHQLLSGDVIEIADDRWLFAIDE